MGFYLNQERTDTAIAAHHWYSVTQAILAGNNWTTWLPYVITAVEQLTLTAMWVWYCSHTYLLEVTAARVRKRQLTPNDPSHT
jgi:hypothetical protein